MKKKKKNVGYTNLYIIVEEMNNSVSIYTNCSSISWKENYGLTVSFFQLQQRMNCEAYQAQY